MQDHYSAIDRMFRQLAGELQYEISCEELSMYLRSLETYSFVSLSNACMKFASEERPQGTFPSVSEFERKMKEPVQSQTPEAGENSDGVVQG